MIIDEDNYDFLEQSGVRGMHWGVRKASRTPKTPAQKRVRNNKIAAAAMIAVGAALAGKMLAGQISTMKARSAANIYNASKKVKVAQQINDIISMNTGVRTVTLTKSLGR